MLTDKEMYIQELIAGSEFCEQLGMKHLGSFINIELHMQPQELVDGIKNKTNVYSLGMKRSLTKGELGHLIHREDEKRRPSRLMQLSNNFPSVEAVSFAPNEASYNPPPTFSEAIEEFAPDIEDIFLQERSEDFSYPSNLDTEC